MSASAGNVATRSITRAPTPASMPRSGFLQRKCACGAHSHGNAECAECAKKHDALQRKLTIGASDDPLEQEADRVVDQVLAKPTQSGVSHVPLRIQRFAGHSTGQMSAAPSSVDRTLAGPGRPLEPVLRQDMERRFGYDFSRVRVHSGAAAEQSAQDVNAHAYAVGYDLVFGVDRFAPGTQEGRRLIAHELAHVIQQTSPGLPPRELPVGPPPGTSANSASIRIGHLPSRIVQRDVDTETEANWSKLSPSVREEARDLDDECDGWISTLVNVQMVHSSSLRSEWLDHLREVSTKIENLDSDHALEGVKKDFKVLTTNIGRLAEKFGEEWASIENRYREEDRWLRSTNMKSTASIEAAKYLEEIYRQVKPKVLAYLTDEDYNVLKIVLDKQEYVRVGALRGARIRVRELKQMMDSVADLLRKGEDANKFIPEWSDRVSEEAAYLESFAQVAKEAGRDYAPELADLRKELLQKQLETSKVKPPEESGLEKLADLVEGGVEAIAGIFVEAAKEAVDLVQINLHFVTFGKYEPKFISDMAAAAEQGASTGDLLRGMVTSIVETPSRFLKACRDGDWKAIGRESVNLYMLAKTIKEAPETLKKIPEAAKRVPELLAKTRESLRILRQRTVALGLKSEGRLSPEPLRQHAPKPAAQIPPAPKPATTPTVKPGGGQGSGKPTGMLRDVDAPSLGVEVDASHPILKDKTPANDPPKPPQTQAAKVAVNAPRDAPHAQQFDPPQSTPAPGRNADSARMGKKPSASNKTSKKKSGPPAAELDPGEGELSKKQRRGDAPKQERVSTGGKVPIKDSAWLNGRLPEIEDQRLFLQWIEDGHYGEHPHLVPYDEFADGLLEEWNETLSKKRVLGPRRGAKR